MTMLSELLDILKEGDKVAFTLSRPSPDKIGILIQPVLKSRAELSDEAKNIRTQLESPLYTTVDADSSPDAAISQLLSSFAKGHAEARRPIDAYLDGLKESASKARLEDKDAKKDKSEKPDSKPDEAKGPEQGDAFAESTNPTSVL